MFKIERFCDLSSLHDYAQLSTRITIKRTMEKKKSLNKEITY